MLQCQWISALFKGVLVKNECINRTKFILNYPCETSSSCSPFLITLSPGIYRIEVRGAQGGINDNYGANGGVNSGTISIYHTSSFYAFIGAKGTSKIGAKTEIAYNGGGSGYAYHPTQLVASGGGATDLRLSLDLSSRIIIAGGGGGSGYQSRFTGASHGGIGGGINGGNASTGGAKGATQNLPGLTPVAGSLLNGANAKYSSDSDDACGGGGGLYGGAAGKSYSYGGGGGSGFVNSSIFDNISYSSGMNEGDGAISFSVLRIYHTKKISKNNRTIISLWFIVFISTKKIY